MGVSSLLILLAKSEAPPIYLRRNPENHVWQRTGSCETDFASSIKDDDDPTSFTLVGNSADSRKLTQYCDTMYCTPPHAPHHLPAEAGEARCSRSGACRCWASCLITVLL
jgi:hypothetical protein